MPEKPRIQILPDRDPPMSSEEMRFKWGATDSGSTSGSATEKPKPWISASHLWVVYNTTELC